MGLGTTSYVSSAKKKKQTTQSVTEAGITEQYQSLLDNFQFEEAQSLLEENNVDFGVETYYHDDSSAEGGFSTNDYFKKSSSSVQFYHSYWDSNPERYALSLQWDLRNVQADVDAPVPIDKAALAFDNQSFGYWDDSIKHSGEIETNDGIYPDQTEVIKEPVSDTQNGGVVSFYDQAVADGSAEGYGYMQMIIFRRSGGDPGVVSGSYTHTWSIGGLAGSGVTANIDLGGFISWSNPLDAGRWVLPGNDARDTML